MSSVPTLDDGAPRTKLRLASAGVEDWVSIAETSQGPLQSWYIYGDLLCLMLVGIGGALLRPVAQQAFSASDSLSTAAYWSFYILFTTIVLLGCAIQDLHCFPPRDSVLVEQWAILKSVACAVVVEGFCLALLHVSLAGFVLVCFVAAGSFSALSGWRGLRRFRIHNRVERDLAIARVLVVGTGKTGKAFASYLDRSKHLGYKVVGFLDSELQGSSALLGTLDDFRRVVREHFVDEVFITRTTDRMLVARILEEAAAVSTTVKVVEESYHGARPELVSRLGRFHVLELHRSEAPVLGLFLKRFLDLVLGTALLIIVLPVCGLIALAIRLDSPGKCLYWSRRVSLKGRIFNCCKFRTMVDNADALRGELEHLNERERILFKISNDPRITRVGRLLRKYSLDELPQLLNVIGGDMSLVGPRPPLAEEYSQYSPDERERLLVKPGITGLWQVTSRQDPSFESYMRADLKYIRNWSLLLDVEILLKTIPVVFKGTGS